MRVRQPRSVGSVCWRRTVRTGETLSIFDHSRESLVLVKREQEGQFGKKTKLSQENQELSALFAKQPSPA